MTYRGGAASRQRTFDLVSGMLHTTSLNPMAHLICVAHSRLELADILVTLRKAGVENLMALGGDPPADPERRTRVSWPTPPSWSSWPAPSAASPSAWPPTRPGIPVRPSTASDRDFLAAKLEMADFGITQFFFEASEYEGLRGRPRCPRGRHPRPARDPARDLPRLHGPPGRNGGAGARRGCRSACRLPTRPEGPRRCAARGCALATELCADLLTLDVPGLHFYTFNTSSATREIYAALGLGPSLPRRAAGCGRPELPNWDGADPPPSIEEMPEKISMGADGALHVPDEPIIPFIEGDGTGVDIWPAAKLVLDAAAAKHGNKVAWKEVLAGQKAFDETGNWLPDETVESFREHLIGIKGPLTTPIGGGIRSLNVALRQILDLYVCLRPVRWFTGVPSPVLHPELVDMVIFRENTEDIYAGYEVQEGTPEALKLMTFLRDEMDWPVRDGSGIGIKPISEMGSKRLIRAAIKYALEHGRASVTMVHKGNIQKFTEGAFMNWGYELVREEFADVAVGWDDCGGDAGRQAAGEGLDRRHHPAAGPDPARPSST